MLLISGGIDQAPFIWEQSTGLTLHVRKKINGNFPKSVPLIGPLSLSKDNKNLAVGILKSALPFGLSHIVLRTHVFEQIHVPSSSIDGSSPTRRTLLHRRLCNHPLHSHTRP